MAQAAAAANRILSFRVREEQTPKAISDLQDTKGGVKIQLRDIWVSTANNCSHFWLEVTAKLIDIQFKYPTRDIPIFTGLNLTIEKGQFAALVGPSGCGKTSIVSLLERYPTIFYTPKQTRLTT